MRILITGAGGQLGRAFARALEKRATVLSLGRAQLDVADRDAVGRSVGAFAPDLIVHAAAFTAVDRAETERRAAFRANVRGTAHVLEAAAAARASVITFSSDMVFDGVPGQPVLEEAQPSPPNRYGWTKCLMERLCEDADDVLVVRTSWVWGGPESFPYRIAQLARERGRLDVVDDQFSLPCHVSGLVERTLRIFESGTRGTVHVADAGAASKYEITAAVLDFLEIGCELRPVRGAAWNAAAARAAWSVLSLERTERLLGHTLPHWKDVMRDHIGRGPQ